MPVANEDQWRQLQHCNRVSNTVSFVPTSYLTIITFEVELNSEVLLCQFVQMIGKTYFGTNNK